MRDGELPHHTTNGKPGNFPRPIPEAVTGNPLYARFRKFVKESGYVRRDLLEPLTGYQLEDLLAAWEIYRCGGIAGAEYAAVVIHKTDLAEGTNGVA